MILKPDADLDRDRVMDALRNGGVEFRMITGGCFPHHAAVKFFDYDIVGNLDNAQTAHERGFFVGNHPYDLGPQLRRLREVLDEATFDAVRLDERDRRTLCRAS
jgi:CDP-6-deoxy-D-xylo-4-hexulose-3-dehydrase